MSDSAPQNEYKEAKANAKAEKARAKAMRPWFKKKRFILPLAIVAIAIISSASNAGNSGSSSTDSSSNADSSNTEAAAMATIGDTVTDGDFSFVVTKMKCGVSSYGGEYANVKAQGQYCQFNVEVTNNGNDAQYFSGDDQLLFSADGKEYESDSSAAIYADSSNTWLDEINPGNTLKGLVIFDVPEGIELSHLELHDSMFSSGVEVSVK
ncbi:MAG: hypothetical protein RL118_1032 [Actinomycetota bacterium]